MVATLERSYARTVLVKSPIRSLYHEMRTAASVIRFMPVIDDFVATSDEHVATILTTLCLGPVSWQFTGRLELEEVDPPHRLGISITVPSPQLDFIGEFHYEVSSAEETNLRYEATVRTDQPLLRRMRSSLVGSLEEYVDSTTERVAILARQYADAERRFSELEPPHGSG
jgi:carbon monoxide dehydrogenase subunit G